MTDQAKSERLHQFPVDELERRFTYHPPVSESQKKRYVEIRGTAYSMAVLLNNCCPDSREKALALTKLEEVVFWANASIARNEH